MAGGAPLHGIAITVVTVSDRSASGTRADESGPLLAHAFDDLGATVATMTIPDGAANVAVALRAALNSGARVVVSTGGTGLSPRDQTPEGTRELLVRELPGIAERLRAVDADSVPASALSRGIAGVTADGAIIVNVAGLNRRGAFRRNDPGRDPASRALPACWRRPLIAFARLTAEPLSLDRHVSAVAGPAQGAISTFVGTVRDHDPAVAGTVTALEYSAHPDAAAALARIVAQTAPDTASVAVSHRIGRLEVGEAAIIVAVAAAHREEAFDACRTIVEAVKAHLPVWKREILADGSYSWVGLT